jgi:SAM-dependent methyltransferase
VDNLVPASLKRIWQRARIAYIRNHNRGRQVTEIFNDIYLRNRWGGEQGSFNSGSGSTNEHAQLYAQVIRQFIRDHNVQRVVDLGCGDFRIGVQLIDTGIEYIGIDVVESLVRRNRELYGSARVSFECSDIIEDALPEADLCLIRQVLQHLSNEQITRVLRNAGRYRYVLVTEHYPALHAARCKNLDKPCGEDVRVYDGSAVYLDAPPFNQALSAPLLDVDAGRYLLYPGERIRTYLIENAPVTRSSRSVRLPMRPARE